MDQDYIENLATSSWPNPMQCQSGYNPLQRIQDFANNVEKPGRLSKESGVPKTKRVRYEIQYSGAIEPRAKKVESAAIKPTKKILSSRESIINFYGRLNSICGRNSLIGL